MSGSLSEVGYRLDTNRNLNYLRDNLRSYELHVIKDHVVSIPYYYQRENGVTYSLIGGKRIPLELDARERGGFYRYGLDSAFDLVKMPENQEKLIFLYSPPGPSSFEENPPEDYKKPYHIGQLYLLYKEGDKLLNLAISVNQQGENWLKEIFPDKYFGELKSKTNEVEKITYQITTPWVSDMTINDFVDRDWQYQGQVYKSKSYLGERVFNTSQVLTEIQKSLKGELETEFDHQVLAHRMVRDGGSRFDGYDYMIGYIMETTGLSRIPLGGSCGGSDVKKSEGNFFETPNLSSRYRKFLQEDDEDYKNDPNLCRCGNREPHFHCPGKTDKGSCQYPIIVGKGTSKCPGCGLEATCK